MSELVQDLVCGMSVDPTESTFVVELHGNTYHFCSEQCRSQFLTDPGRFSRY